MLLGINRSLGAAAGNLGHRIGHRGELIVRGTALAAAACAVGACTGTAVPTGSAQGGTVTVPAEQTISATGGFGPAPAAAWPTYGQNAGRTGVAPGLATAGVLHRKWAASLDGAVYAQPLVVGDDVIAATENDTVYALNAATGRVAWRSHVAAPVRRSTLPCGNIDPLGITGTPVYDQATGLVYAVAETRVSYRGRDYYHELVGLSARTGRVLVRRVVPLPTGHGYAHQQRPALTLDRGRVVIGFGGLAGDCDQYTGTVVAVSALGGGPLIEWRVPTSREGGIWAIGGPVVGPDGDLWLSVGNGANGSGQPYDGSDSVSRLTFRPDGLLLRDFFAPGTWADDNENDLDLGSTQPVLAARDATFILGKRGIGYLLYTESMGGIGHQAAAKPVCPAFGAGAVDGDTVYEPCSDAGLAAIAVDVAAGSIRVLWHGPSNAHGSASIGGGAVWVPDSDDGILYELDPGTGRVRHQIVLGAPLPRFSSVSLAGDAVFVGTMNGVVAVAGA
jgi:polyvinyl alcohol dehydrogenase (cytochrome)